MSDDEDAGQFFTIVSWLVETKEQFPRNRDYRWSEKDLLHIKVGLLFMKEHEKATFMDRFKDYMIIKALAGDVNHIRSAEEERPAKSI